MKTTTAAMIFAMIFLLAGAVIGAFLARAVFEAQAAARPGRERVELVSWRTRLPHEGCPSGGCWEARGAPRMIEAYGINKPMWPHRCTGCAATNEIYDARWPKIEQEWRPVR